MEITVPPHFAGPSAMQVHGGLGYYGTSRSSVSAGTTAGVPLDEAE